MNKHPAALISLFSSTALLLSICVSCIGILVCLGWMVNTTLLKSISSHYIAMSPNAAIAFTFSGISLLLQRLSLPSQHIALMLGKLLGVIVTLLGCITLFKYMLDYNSYINPIILQKQSSPMPEKDSLMTALSFTCIGLALILLDIKYSTIITQILSIIVGLCGLLMLTGLTYNTLFASQLALYSYASIHTAICFLFLSLSLLLIHPAKGIMRVLSSKTEGGIVARKLIPFTILIPMILGQVIIIGEYNQLYDTLTGVALYSIVIIFTFIFITMLIATLLMNEDIKREKVEWQLRHSYDDVEDMYNNAPCGYHSLDEDGIFTRVNLTELEWLEYTRDEIVGKKKFLDLLTPESRHIFQEHFEKFKKRGVIHDLELELIRKSGSVLTVLLNATSAKHPNGQYLMSRVTMFDISERKRMDQALRLSEERFRNTMNTAPIGMAIISLKGQYVEVNNALCQIVGYEKSEIEKMTFQKITYPEDLAIDLASAQQLIEGKIPLHQVEKRYIRKDGKVIWVQLTASILKDTKTANPLYFITQIEDITERKHTEEIIRSLAYHDTLTNLPNRRLLLDTLNHTLASAKRHHRIFAIMFLDLDKFKQINDSLGHDTGDELLKAIAVRLTAALRFEDTVARISGDEFVIILNELKEPQDAAIVANKIINSIQNPFLILGHEIKTSISIGIAIFPENGIEPSDLMKKADSAMYAAKESGRNQYQFYQDKYP
ncbi:MAG: diguanylate cyclase [Gammaproteobacteria bacterium]|nr:diguanylate cyclase [Gammaproteobacteria bacterium]MCW5584236.1 diguanylate cyclase [Gammaproteobacteria bacterium]